MWDLEQLLSESVEAAKERERTAFDERAGAFGERLVLFGAGGFGRRVLAGLRSLGIEPAAFADNHESLWGSQVHGLRVMSPLDAAAEFGANAVFLLTIWNGHDKDRVADRVAQLRRLGCWGVI